MAENKKSFITYCEWQETFIELTDEEAGKLIKHIFKYVNDENPKTDSKTVKLCFIPIKQTLKRDLKKYEVYIDKQRENGAKGGRPKKTQITQRLNNKPKKADSVNVSVNDNVNKLNTNVLAEFKNSLQTFSNEFDKNMINDFYLYWTEKKPRGKKMRFEMEKTFDISRRLTRWNNNNFNKDNKNDKREAISKLSAAIREENQNL